ncbi:unnamed protein product [Brassica rapa subsp. narinosa]
MAETSSGAMQQLQRLPPPYSRKRLFFRQSTVRNIPASSLSMRGEMSPVFKPLSLYGTGSGLLSVYGPFNGLGVKESGFQFCPPPNLILRTGTFLWIGLDLRRRSLFDFNTSASSMYSYSTDLRCRAILPLKANGLDHVPSNFTVPFEPF